MQDFQIGGTSVHASAVLIGDFAVLIRGPSGSGKSRLAFDLILAGRTGKIPAAILIGDDRVHLGEEAGAVTVRPAPALAGMIEIRGLGIRRCAYAPRGPVSLVVDLAAPDAARHPDAAALQTQIGTVALSRIPVGTGHDPLPLVLAALITAPCEMSQPVSADCRQDSGNHMRFTLAWSDL